MHMSFEKIPAPANDAEHPAAKAARIVKGYHVETIAKIDGGFVFTHDGVDVNEKLRAACVQNIAECDALIERASTMDPALYDAATVILREAESVKND